GGPWGDLSASPLLVWRTSGDGTFEPLELAGDEELRATRPAVSPDGLWLAALGGFGQIWAWDLQAPKTPPRPVRGPFPPEQAGQPLAVAVGRQGHVLASGPGHAVTVWDLNHLDAKPVEFRKHNAPVIAAVFSEDGRHVFTGDVDGIVWAWSLDDLEPNDPYHI